MKKPFSIDNKVLLFDFDGTVVETEILAREVIEAYFLERNLPAGGDFAGLIVGKTWRLAIEMMQDEAKARGFQLGESGALEVEFKRRYQDRFKKGVNLIPGFREVFPEVRKRARYIGIVTGSERHEVELILDSHGMRGGFDRIWGFGDYEESKPHPSPYLTALREIGVLPGDVLVFEDSKAGMESAFRAGLNWIQITHEAHAREADPRSLMAIRDWREFKV